MCTFVLSDWLLVGFVHTTLTSFSPDVVYVCVLVNGTANVMTTDTFKGETPFSNRNTQNISVGEELFETMLMVKTAPFWIDGK
jgi:hypothetical protein